MLRFNKNSKDLSWNRKQKYHLKTMCKYFDKKKNASNSTLAMQISEIDEKIQHRIKNYKLEFWDSQKEKLDEILKTGHDNLIKYCRIVTSIATYTLFDYQLILLHRVLMTDIPSFFYDVWDQYKQAILDYYDLEKEFAIILSLAERRGGKTVFLEMHFLALLLSMTEKKDKPYIQSIYSVNLKRSQSVIEESWSMLSMVPDRFKKHVDIYVKAVEIEFVNKITGKKSKLDAQQTGQVSPQTPHINRIRFG